MVVYWKGRRALRDGNCAAEQTERNPEQCDGKRLHTGISLCTGPLFPHLYTWIREEAVRRYQKGHLPHSRDTEHMARTLTTLQRY